MKLHFSYTPILVLALLLCTTQLHKAEAAHNEILLKGSRAEVESLLQTFEKKKIFLQNSEKKSIPLSLEGLKGALELEEEQGILLGKTFVKTVRDSEKSTTYTRIKFKKDRPTSDLLFGEEKSSFSKPVSHLIIKKKPGSSDYEFSGKLLDGYEIEENALQRMLLMALEQNGTVRSLLVPQSYSKGEIRHEGVESHEQLELVTQGVSDFKGSSKARLHNIVTAYARFQGLSIKPDEVFSFNKILGPVDASTGYAKELVIKGPKTVPDWGGGVCQVSSTVYRAALEGGLPIVTRRNHSYAVSYYEPWGTDATIYPGVQDLEFRNDTGHALIVQIYHEDTKLYVNFYGKKDGRKVELNGPVIYDRRGTPSPTVEVTSSLPTGKQVLKAYGHAGFSAYWMRKVTLPNGETKNEKFTSVYEARPGHVLRGA